MVNMIDNRDLLAEWALSLRRAYISLWRGFCVGSYEVSSSRDTYPSTTDIGVLVIAVCYTSFRERSSSAVVHLSLSTSFVKVVLHSMVYYYPWHISTDLTSLSGYDYLPII